MAVERYYIEKREVEGYEAALAKMASVRRYRFVRKYCSGRVLDVGCGCGYGSYMLSKSPDVEHVLGIDASANAIEFARGEYHYDKTSFFATTLAELGPPYNGEGSFGFQTIVALEVLEHLEKPEELFKLATRVHAERMIVSFPNYRTAHFNKHHLHDFQVADVERMATAAQFERRSRRTAEDTYAMDDEVTFVFLRRSGVWPNRLPKDVIARRA